jgi:hypothetical protein
MDDPELPILHKPNQADNRVVDTLLIKTWRSTNRSLLPDKVNENFDFMEFLKTHQCAYQHPQDFRKPETFRFIREKIISFCPFNVITVTCSCRNS